MAALGANRALGPLSVWPRPPGPPGPISRPEPDDRAFFAGDTLIGGQGTVLRRVDRSLFRVDSIQVDGGQPDAMNPGTRGRG